MLAMLAEAQKEQLEKSREAAGELLNLMEREAFANGFCFAAKIMDTMEIPSVDE